MAQKDNITPMNNKAKSKVYNAGQYSETNKFTFEVKVIQGLKFTCSDRLLANTGLNSLNDCQG